MLRILFILISMIVSVPAFALQSFSARMKIEKQVTVGASKDFTLNFSSSKGEVITIGCANNTDTFEWPHLKDLINDTPLYNFGMIPFAKADIHTLTREDFYCDTLSGKQDEAVYQVFNRISGAVGKDIKIIADVDITVVWDGKLRTDVFNITGLKFYDGDNLLADFGRPGDRSSQTLVGFSGVKIVPNKP